MTKDEINGLINAFCDYLGTEAERPIKWIEAQKAIEALTEYRDSLDKFDVLEHLRNGGSIERKSEPGIYYTWNVNNVNFLCPSTDKVSSKFVHCLITLDDWQPYEPTVEDMLEDGCAYWVKNSDGQKFAMVSLNDTWVTSHRIVEKKHLTPVLRDGKPIKIEVPR